MTASRAVHLRLGLLLRQAHRHAARTLNDALAPLGLTGRHFGVLMMLVRDGVSTQRDLIRQTGSDKAGMTRTVEDLESLGHITRTPSAADRRVAEIRLTTQGRRVALGQGSTLASGVGDTLFGEFTDTELAIVESVLARLVGGDPEMRD